jgi:DNA mismatch repair protein MutL
MARIKLLRPEVARLIAAGEVIERPQSALRELLDNAIDSGARSIAVDIEGGGLGLIRVTDDGSGMGPEDLAASVLPHATSKIEREDDLLTVRSLGFRGEALASIAAVAELSMVSMEEGGMAHRLSAKEGGPARVEPASGRRGTMVEVRGLFEGFPARRRFMKRPQDEWLLCKQAFVEKACAFPDIRFSLKNEGRAVIELLPADRVSRVVEATGQGEKARFFKAARGAGPGFRFEIAAGLPDIARPDRRNIWAFANGRRLQDAGLVKAIELGYDAFLPGGLYPQAYLFIDIDPSLVDFNIHPAKREARFRDLQALTSQVRACLREFLHKGMAIGMMPPSSSPRQPPGQSELEGLGTGLFSRKASDARASYYQPSWGGASSIARGASPEGVAMTLSKGFDAADGASGLPSRRAIGPADAGFRYLGQALGLLLVCEREGSLYLIDQHAAHERILYDSFKAQGGKRAQALLMPLTFELDSEAGADALEGAISRLKALGVGITRDSASSFSITSLPEGAAGTEGEIVDYLRDGELDGLEVELYARMACRAAVKEGEALDDLSAAIIARQAFELAEPRCPHGRPVWIRLDEDEVYKRLLRTLA